MIIGGGKGTSQYALVADNHVISYNKVSYIQLCLIISSLVLAHHR